MNNIYVSMDNNITVLNTTQPSGHLEFWCYVADFIFFERVFFGRARKYI